MFTINTNVTFEASHKLEGMPEGHQCARLHGHSYRVQVTIAAVKLNAVGMVIDTGLIKQAIRDRYDHQNLNDKVAVNPTAENMAQIIHESLSDLVQKHCFGNARVSRVAVHETENSFAEYLDESEESF